MTVEADIFSRLSGYSGLTALVSTRIYPVRLPQKPTYPAIVYTRISAERISAMGDDTGTVRPRFQFDVYATTYANARAVTEQLRKALQRYSGTDTVTIQEIFVIGESEFYEDETELYHTAIDFEIIYIED